MNWLDDQIFDASVNVAAFHQCNLNGDKINHNKYTDDVLLEAVKLLRVKANKLQTIINNRIRQRVAALPMPKRIKRND